MASLKITTLPLDDGRNDEDTGFPVKIETIKKLKEHVRYRYSLDERDQYYCRDTDEVILKDDVVLRSLQGLTLRLKLDEHLTVDKLKEEQDKLVLAAGYDMGPIPGSTWVINSACKTATNLHGIIPGVDKKGVHLNELRMLKRMDRNRVKAKERNGLFSVISQFGANTKSFTKNAVQGVARIDADSKHVKDMRENYKKIGQFEVEIVE